MGLRGITLFNEAIRSGNVGAPGRSFERLVSATIAGHSGSVLLLAEFAIEKASLWVR
jgi:hypothetical protein